jgi:carbonic anhydrase
VVVVHHTHCGATTFTADGIINAFKDEHCADIAALYPRASICISDYVSSLRHDTRLLRESPGTPPDADIYGYVYNIDTGALTQVVSDVAQLATTEPAALKHPDLRSRRSVAGRKD